MSEFVMLAKPYKDQNVAGWFVSEKFDGQRCFWDGGVTRGKPKKDIPWANTDKDERYVTEPVSTGLWSRYGNVIHAPGWFLDKLPTNLLLDGELWLDRGKFQQTRSIISKLNPIDDEWKDIKFLVFDSPSVINMFDTRTINNVQFKKYIKEETCKPFFKNVRRRLDSFSESMDFLTTLGLPNVVKQVVLPKTNWRPVLYDMLENVVSQGGEGLMLRDPWSVWYPKRSGSLLKVKPMELDEGVIVGYMSGLGKYLGMLGSIKVQWNGGVFELSGFTDEERLLPFDASEWAVNHPGKELPKFFSLGRFPLGTLIRFKYTSLTDVGYPREARYAR